MAAPHTALPTAHVSLPSTTPRRWRFVAPDGRSRVVVARLWVEARALAAIRLHEDPQSLLHEDA